MALFLLSGPQTILKSRMLRGHSLWYTALDLNPIIIIRKTSSNHS